MNTPLNSLPQSQPVPQVPPSSRAPRELDAFALELPGPTAVARVRRIRQQLVAQGWMSGLVQ